MFLNWNLDRTVRLFIGMAAFFSLAGISVDVLKYGFGHAHLWEFYSLLQLDSEGNLPNLYQGLSIATTALVLRLVSRVVGSLGKPDAGRWRFLSWAFFYVALDELLVIHERTIVPLRTAFHTSGVLYFAWLILGFLAVTLLAFISIPWLQHLPRPVALWFLVGAFIYLSGTLAMEMVGGWYASHLGADDLFYALITDLEEILEMTGVLVFLSTVVRYIHVLTGSTTVQLSLKGTHS